MERLTARYNGHAIMAWEHENKYTTEEWIDILTARLAAYEDTGLEPEEVNRCKLTLMGKSLAEITEFDGVAINRLKELATADKQGRLVVLPCPMGSTIYMIVTKHTKGREPFSFIKTTELMESNVFRVCRDYGKTVFLTREEAERALEEGAE